MIDSANAKIYNYVALLLLLFRTSSRQSAQFALFFISSTTSLRTPTTTPKSIFGCYVLPPEAEDAEHVMVGQLVVFIVSRIYLA